MWGKELSTTTSSPMYARRVSTVIGEVIKDFGRFWSRALLSNLHTLGSRLPSVKQRNIIIVVVKKVNREWGMNHFQKFVVLGQTWPVNRG